MLQSPKNLLLKQWRSLYDLGLALGPAAAVLACATLGGASFAKYRMYPTSNDWQALGIAALGTVSMIPFTWIFLLPTNALLLAECDKRAEERMMTEAQLKATVAKWGNINLIRGVLPLVSTMFGLWTALH